MFAFIVLALVFFIFVVPLIPIALAWVLVELGLADENSDSNLDKDTSDFP